MKLVYITAKAPFGSQETFIINEMLALKSSGIDLLIIPRDKDELIFHKNGELLIDNTLCISWFDLNIFMYFFQFIFKNPLKFFHLLNIILLKAKNIKIGLKNLLILPKALYVSKLLKRDSVSHIHAHWASTTATMAFIISKVTGIPWSFTAHRWDIKENNLLKEKCKTASFVRAISDEGRKEIIKIVKDESLTDKISVIHMGVILPEYKINYKRESDIFIFICPANFVPVKGHRYLLEACKILLDKRIKFRCLLAGDGPLERELKEFVKNNNLNYYVEFLDRLSNERLLELYEKGIVDAVVLPSIITQDGEKEGIPVALMEAMSYAIPVISTDTGGISELIGNENGIMIREKDQEAIAKAVERLIKDKKFYYFTSQNGRRKIEKEFNMSLISKELLGIFFNNRKTI